MIADEEGARLKAAFKARPAKILTAAPFTAKKSTKPLTEIRHFNKEERDEKRKEQRAQLEAQIAQKRAAMAQMAEAEAKAKAAKAAVEVKAMRQAMVHKARSANVLKHAPFVAKKAPPSSLTQPISPDFVTKARGALRTCDAHA